MAPNDKLMNENEAVIDFARDLLETKILKLDGSTIGAAKDVEVMVVPKGATISGVRKLLEEYLPRPERKRGTAYLTTLDSFISHTNRHASANSVLFACDDMSKPSIQTVFDYNEGTPNGLPDWCQHRASYSFPLSKEWTAWTTAPASMEQKAFAEFLEDRITDVYAPVSVTEGTRDLCAQLGIILAGPERLMELARSLSIQVDRRVKNAVNLSTGEAELVYEESHSASDVTKVKVPTGFVITIPIFTGGPLYQIPVRLRYRLVSGVIRWSFVIAKAEDSFRHAFEEACVDAQKRTGLTLFYGSPER